MAEGIMGLAPGMGAPAAPQQAPQQAGPDGMQAFLQAAGQMDSAEVEPQMDEALSEIDPALAQQLQAELSAIQLPPEIVQVLLDVVNGLLEAPGEYAQRRMEVIEAGLPPDFLPEEFDVEYLSTLRFVLMRLPMQEPEVPVQGFKDGGAVSLKPVAKFLAAQGRNGDTMLAHINKSEAALLKRLGGSGTINPVTGLREYFLKKAWKAVTKTVKSVGNAVAKVVKPVINVTKKLLANPIVRTVATVAAAVFLGPMAASAVGAGAGTALSAAVGTSISTAGVSLLAGEKPKDALKQGLMAGTVAGVGAYAMGAPLTQSTQDYGLNLGGKTYGIRDTVGQGVDSINPFSSSTPAVTADTEFAKLTAKGLPANAETYRLATEAAKSANATTILGMSPSTAITTAATVLPPILAYAGQEPPPSPEDLNIPGVGGPTGADLLERDPGKYGVTIGDVSNTYRDPYAGIADSPAFNIGGTQPPSGEPGSMPEGGSSTPSSGFAPVGVPMPGSEQYESMYSAYDPTRDPMSPLYNPFALPSSGTSPNTGGFDIAQGFAKGGIATLAPQGFARGGGVTPPTYGAKMKPTKQTELAQRQRAAEERKYQTALAGSVSNYNSMYNPNPPKKTQAELFREAEASRLATQRAEERSAADRNKRVQAQVNMAMKAAQEGRQFEMGPGYASERDIYAAAIANARQLTPTKFMSPDQAEAYLARQRSENLAAERAKFDQDQAAAVARAKAQEEALAIKAKSDRELADFEAYKASILGPGGSTQPVVPGGSTPPTAGPAPTIPSAPIQDIGIGSPMPPTTGPAPTAPILPEINIGSSTAPGGGVVYGPDGTEYPSASAAITAGVFNYSMAPPPTGGIGALAPTTPSFSIPDFSMPSFTTPDFSTQTPVAFANGGIAAMAPYKFSRGSSPVQHYPRRTGPINGPGTGTSDSIPAMLSDGEFVFTAKAVKGMGNGSRLQGAKKMYKMMKMLEGKG
jgi:hypothetical protein